MAELRPRYGRIGALAVAVAVCATSVLGGAGVLPGGSVTSYADTRAVSPEATVAQPPQTGALSLSSQAAKRSGRADERDPAPVPLPADSGEGKRVVLDLSQQRVWLVGARGVVRRTYLVSGSVYDNLEPGTYEVYSRSRQAVGIDGSTMEHMVRFARGDNAAIGFHGIPWAQGRPLQTTAQLGTPLSHGCIRQAEPDARALWRFAPVGTTVVVTG